MEAAELGRVITAGETMALVVPPSPGRLRHATSLSLSIGGAESNVAIGLARLGIPASWISVLGDDELGELVLHRLRAEGVDTSGVRRIADRATGLYLREEVAGRLRVYYYRSGSAAATLSPNAFDPSMLLQGAAFLHLTGITGALSQECAEFLPWAATTARDAGVRVSYDVNYRSRLWEPSAAQAATEALLPLIDVLFVGHDEANALWGWETHTALEQLSKIGPSEVILKLGADGCAAMINGEQLTSPGFPARQLDPIGAGDAFDAGYLAATLWGWAPEKRLRAANAMGAFCVQNLGDYEGLPDRRELDSFLEQIPDLGR